VAASVRLTPPTRTVVIGSPAYFDKHGVPQRPEDLLQHDCINCRQISRAGLYRWEFQRNGEEFEIAVKGRVIANDTLTLIRCAVDARARRPPGERGAAVDRAGRGEGRCWTSIRRGRRDSFFTWARGKCCRS
jgi:hypothetical protein